MGKHRQISEAPSSPSATATPAGGRITLARHAGRAGLPKPRKQRARRLLTDWSLSSYLLEGGQGSPGPSTLSSLVSRASRLNQGRGAHFFTWAGRPLIAGLGVGGTLQFSKTAGLGLRPVPVSLLEESRATYRSGIRDFK
jgi:hypothetical protein